MLEEGSNRKSAFVLTFSADEGDLLGFEIAKGKKSVWNDFLGVDVANDLLSAELMM